MLINPNERMPILPKTSWLLAASFAFVFSPTFLPAQDATKELSESSTIKTSRSPDGSREITFGWASPRIGAEGNVYVHVLQTNKFLGPFPWVGFGDPCEALWRADNKAFAIKGERARGSVVCKVYQLQQDGRYHLVKTPDLARCVADKYHLETSGKGGEHPVEWLPGNCLAVDVYDRWWRPKDQGDVEQPYRVTLQLPTNSGVKFPKATIHDIRPIDIP